MTNPFEVNNELFWNALDKYKQVWWKEMRQLQQDWINSALSRIEWKNIIKILSNPYRQEIGTALESNDT